MKFSLKRHVQVISGIALIVAAGLNVVTANAATDYPTKKPIRLVVGYPAGGSTDLNGRLLGNALSEKIGQSVVVENLGGAGGSIAAQKIVFEEPDGYTLLIGAINEVVIAQLVNPNVKYDGLKDFTPIGLIGSQPLIITAGKHTGVKTLDEFVKLASSEKSKDSNFGSSGVGTSLHLTGEMINMATGGKIQHIPYRGVSPLVTDMVGGQLDFGVFGFTSALPQIQAGTVIPIGITAQKRIDAAPEIPALAEAPALKSIDVELWFGLFGPPNMPEPVVKKLQTVLNEIVNDPKFQDEYKRTGGTVITKSPDMPKFLAAEQAKFKSAVDAANIGK